MAYRTSRGRVLLVDDDQIVLDVLTYGLREAEYSVEGCSDAASALAAYKSLPPDVAIIDIGLPDMDGTNLVERLLQFQYRPILVLSGHSDAASVDQAIDSGVIGYLVKPVTTAQLIPSIETAMARFGQLNQCMAQRFGDAGMTARQLAAAMDQLAFGVIIVDRRHRVIHCNHLAGNLLDASAVLCKKQGKLRSKAKGQEFVRMLDNSLDSGDSPGLYGINLHHPDKDVEVQVWATALAGSEVDSDRAAILVINDPSVNTIASSNLLKTLYGFTNKESELAQALGNGLTVNEYCTRAFVTANTARTHLKSIYRKTSTNRQTELIRLLARLFIQVRNA